jgi:hypothetical protein
VAIAKLGAVGLVFPLLWIPCMLLLARTIFGAMARRRARLVRELMARVTEIATEWRGEPERMRVAGAASPGEEVEVASTAEGNEAAKATSRSRT